MVQEMSDIIFGQEAPAPKPKDIESTDKQTASAANAPEDLQFAAAKVSDMDSAVLADVKEMAHEHILAIIEKKGATFAKMDSSALEKFIQGEVQSLIYGKQIPLNDSEVAYVADSLYKEIAGFGPLEDLLADPNVEDVMINGYKDVYVSKMGCMERVQARFVDNAHLLRIVRRILAPLGRRLDESSPMVDARLPDGSRINVIISPLARDGVVVSIRKFRSTPLRAEDLMGLGTFDSRVYELMQEAVRKRCNLVVSGATSTGKTSMLNVLAEFIPAGERLITIEDTAELQLNHHHVVRLESRPGGHEGAGSISIRDLVKNSLRMRPDRVVVGEVRGAEVLDMLQAMSTGHDGSMGTIHASTPRDCLHRLEMLSGFAGFTGNEMSLRRQIASALDLIVQIVRLPSGKRRIYSITEVAGIVDDNILLQDLYRHESRLGPDGQELDNWVPVVPYPKNPKISHIRLT
ncbi:MAG: CpaF family protein [Gammaproteobacteria bacterium]|nr:CpaF family protein [Gammaproteobacteria bacterium]MBU0847902.1 CpaF family protein [Gammaproteobacteria bacterium]MBU1268978.1 CpaF family protein [Gammaproteobacteria bacterium]MBU1529688.1 CpaF family protein [Gammaproteobacteria bacterium]MBU1780061.1 CpaF family protein [Gammaproteobacteria bacterium]